MMSDKKIPVKRNALGRGLAALLDTEDNSSQKTENTGQLSGINEISLESIEVNPYQPRTHFDQEALK